MSALLISALLNLGSPAMPMNNREATIEERRAYRPNRRERKYYKIKLNGRTEG